VARELDHLSQSIFVGIPRSVCSGLPDASVEVLHPAEETGLGVERLPEGTQNISRYVIPLIVSFAKKKMVQ
jgi:hypothetical protein